MSDRELEVIRSRWKTSAPSIEAPRESGARLDIVWLVDLIDQQRERIAEAEADLARVREGLRLALLWMPDIDVRMSDSARNQIAAIRAAYQPQAPKATT